MSQCMMCVHMRLQWKFARILHVQVCVFCGCGVCVCVCVCERERETREKQERETEETLPFSLQTRHLPQRCEAGEHPRSGESVFITASAAGPCTHGKPRGGPLPFRTLPPLLPKRPGLLPKILPPRDMLFCQLMFLQLESCSTARGGGEGEVQSSRPKPIFVWTGFT